MEIVMYNRYENNNFMKAIIPINNHDYFVM